METEHAKSTQSYPKCIVQQFFLDAAKIQLFKGCTISKDNNLLSTLFLGADKEPGTISDKTV